MGRRLLLLGCALALHVDAQRLEVVSQDAKPVLSVRHPDARGNRFGFEGGRVVKVGGAYHLFTSEMVSLPIWAKMRLGHWTSRDGRGWKRVGTLYESSGDCTGADPRGALWSPIPVFDELERRWNLFYVAYRCKPNTKEQFLSNHDGEIWRAVSQKDGEAGIGGPYKDVGVVMRRGPDSLSWEGLQGTDSFFPYRVGDRWYAMYGSARTEKLPIEHWLVGLATAPSVGGPWRRVREHSPLGIERRFIENPMVSSLPGGGYLCVYDSEAADSIGYAVSKDGVKWGAGRALRIQAWAGDVRTPLGLVSERGNEYTVFYTGFEDRPDWDAFLANRPGTARCSIGRVRVRVLPE
ncbi:MAG: hypothetical protein SFV54_20125 [Bryobacteraceae bacterium]|nr:hypothetical protein [Bryobacteraceae bacterium]